MVQPTQINLDLCDLFGDSSSCLLDRCYKKNLLNPSYYIFIRKTGAGIREGRWVMNLSLDLEVVGAKEAMQLYNEDRDRNKKSSTALVIAAPDVLSQVDSRRIDRIQEQNMDIKTASEIRAFNSAFGAHLLFPSNVHEPLQGDDRIEDDGGDVIPIDDVKRPKTPFVEEDDEGSFCHGEDSDNDIAQAKWFTQEEKELVLDGMALGLDSRRYWISCDRTNGRLVTRWEDSERQSLARRSRDVDRIFAARNRKN